MLAKLGCCIKTCVRALPVRAHLNTACSLPRQVAGRPRQYLDAMHRLHSCPRPAGFFTAWPRIVTMPALLPLYRLTALALREPTRQRAQFYER